MIKLSVGEHPFQLSATAESPRNDKPSLLDACWLIAPNPIACYVFAHGAGAGYKHATMQAIAEAFALQGISSLRFNFPYMQAGKKRVDSQSVAVATIASTYVLAAQQSDLPIFVGGHSFGGRMASHAVSQAKLDCQGLILCSFPLHQAKKPDNKRAEHLPEIAQAMLFLSGTRDELARPELLTGVVGGLNKQSRIHWLETANHSYTILKRARLNPTPVFDEMAQQARVFIEDLV
ncbi:MAG: alpha/beta fold hydrolase [Gammaproteobacteria bacterium]|nr:alpha/beta fold hydrolase [Gammaproteobacteria bacterium]